jgi:hypothetical protein
MLPLGGRGTRLTLPRLLPPCLDAHTLPTPAPTAWRGAESPRFLRTRVHSRSVAMKRVQWSIVVSVSSSSVRSPGLTWRGGSLRRRVERRRVLATAAAGRRRRDVHSHGISRHVVTCGATPRLCRERDEARRGPQTAARQAGACAWRAVRGIARAMHRNHH